MSFWRLIPFSSEWREIRKKNKSLRDAAISNAARARARDIGAVRQGQGVDDSTEDEDEAHATADNAIKSIIDYERDAIDAVTRKP